MNFLSEIMALKRERLAGSKIELSPVDVRAQAKELRRGSEPHALRRALKRREGVNIIAEFKRASPSKGIICGEAQPAEMARSYEAGGAVAISVLTEEDRFHGSLGDLRSVRAVTTIPVLRKDFIFEEYQVYESAAAGADAVLLIVAALDDDTLAHLRRITEDELDMDALVEVHTKEERTRALAIGATLLGVNNRDLRTFDVSLEVSVTLSESVPEGTLLVAESGLRSASDLRRLRALGFSGFLIGETLMRSSQPDTVLRALIEEVSRFEC